MILTASRIEQSVVDGDIVITDFDTSRLGPNSYDVTLGNKLLTYEKMSMMVIDGKMELTKLEYSDTTIDPKKDNETYEYEIPEEGLLLEPGILYLGVTNEVAGSNKYIPMYEGKSSVGRLGISSHVTAGFGDVGFINTWTLEITVIHPTIVYPGMKIGQVYFVEPSGDVEKLYRGNYVKHSEEPVASRSKESCF